jgi:hypothetical protein
VPPILYMAASRFRQKEWPLSPDNFVRKVGSLDSIKKKIAGVFGKPRTEAKQKATIPQDQMAFPW